MVALSVHKRGCDHLCTDLQGFQYIPPKEIILHSANTNHFLPIQKTENQKITDYTSNKYGVLLKSMEYEINEHKIIPSSYHHNLLLITEILCRSFFRHVLIFVARLVFYRLWFFRKKIPVFLEICLKQKQIQGTKRRVSWLHFHLFCRSHIVM